MLKAGFWSLSVREGTRYAMRQVADHHTTLRRSVWSVSGEQCLASVRGAVPDSGGQRLKMNAIEYVSRILGVVVLTFSNQQA